MESFQKALHTAAMLTFVGNAGRSVSASMFLAKSCIWLVQKKPEVCASSSSPEALKARSTGLFGVPALVRTISPPATLSTFEFGPLSVAVMVALPAPLGNA